MQQGLVFYPFYIRHFTTPKLLIQPSPTPLPLSNHQSIFYDLDEKQLYFKIVWASIE